MISILINGETACRHWWSGRESNPHTKVSSLRVTTRSHPPYDGCTIVHQKNSFLQAAIDNCISEKYNLIKVSSLRVNPLGFRMPPITGAAFL